MRACKAVCKKCGKLVICGLREALAIHARAIVANDRMSKPSQTKVKVTIFENTINE